jgi:hypothetical protein
MTQKTGEDVIKLDVGLLVTFRQKKPLAFLKVFPYQSELVVVDKLKEGQANIAWCVLKSYRLLTSESSVLVTTRRLYIRRIVHDYARHL